MISKIQPDKIAIITRDCQMSYRQLFQQINHFSALYAQKSYTKIAIFSENRVEWIYAFYAAWQNNCLVVPIDAGASNEDVSYILSDCEPDLIFTSLNLSSKLNSIINNLGHKPKILVFENLTFKGKTDDSLREFPANKDQVAVIIYTSGTTGHPKGVMLTFTNLIANIKTVSQDVAIFTEERQVLMLLPMHHIFPLAGSMMAPLAVGATIVMSSSMLPADLLEILKNNKVNIVIGVPRFYEIMYNNLKSKINAAFVNKILYWTVKMLGNRALAKKIFKKVHTVFGGHIKYLVSGGASLNKEVGRFFKVLGFEVLEGYGMTEAAPMISFTRPGKVLIGSPGLPLPSVKIAIRQGEIVVKGDNIMKGYYNKPAETQEAIKEGWLYTGDLGYLDEKGFLHITGRKKDIIVLANGKNISPVEIEMKLENKNPAIQEAAVFMYHNQLHAVIIPDFTFLSRHSIKDPHTYFKEDLFPKFNQEMSSYKKILQFTLIKGEIPRTKLGKIQRFKLVHLIENQQKKKAAPRPPDSEAYRMIRNFIENEVNTKISPEDHIEYDLGLDSLAKLSLIDFIEQTFGVLIKEENLLGFPSVRLIVDYVQKNKVRHKLEIDKWTESLKERINFKLHKAWPTLPILKNAAKGFFKVYFRLKGNGYHNLPDGPCIITPNHQSFFDGLFVASFIKYKIMKSTYFYAKKKHINNWLLNFLARRNNIIVMDINKGLQESIQKMAEILRKGKKIIIFPEGTRTKTGQLGEFKKMFAILSKELNVPVVPVAITGAFNALPSGRLFPKPFSKIEVNFLKAIDPQLYTHDSLAIKVQEIIGRLVNC